MPRGDAGFKYTDPDTLKEVTVRLQGELRDVSKHEHRQRFTRWSLDGTARDVVTVGSRLHEVLGTVRYQSHVAAFAKMLDHGLSGVELTYYPSLASTLTGIPCQLVSVGGSNDVSFGPDPDTWFRGEHTTDLVLRRVDGDTFDELLNPIVLRYYPGSDLPTFSRASSATYTASDDTIETVASNILRDAHYEDGDRATLLELSRTNGWTYSERIDNAAWSKTRVTVSANAATAPDGAATADKVVEDTTASATHYVTRSTPTLTDNADQPPAIFAKAAGRSWIWISTSDKGGTSRTTWVNLATGEVGTTDAGHTVRTTELADGWWRIEVRFNAATGASSPYYRVGLAPADNSTSYTGDGSSGVYLWGAQFETDKAFASSYIQTVASTVTRAVDVASYALPDAISDPRTPWVRYTRWVAGMDNNGGLSSPRVWQIGDGASNGALWLEFRTTGGSFRLFHVGASISATADVAASVERGDTCEAVVRWNGDGTGTFTVYVNGTSVGSATLSGITPASAWNGGANTYLNSRDAGNNAGAMALQRDAFKEGVPSDVTDAELMAYMRGEAG